VDTLASVPLFSACSERELQTIAKCADHVQAPPGTMLVTQGATGDEFFVILDGSARVERNGTKVSSLGPGNFFGDLALLDRAPRNASVIADTPMELARLGQKSFDQLIELPGFSKTLLAGLARRLREHDSKSLG